jgi:aspartyl/glutamyl-tRNA(Asn/Gln) amidotransferase C subunit
LASGDIDVAYVAKLARLALTPAEIERFGTQLGALLEHVDRLAGLPVDDVAATAAVIAQSNVMRADEVRSFARSRDGSARRAAARRRLFPRAADHRGGRVMEATTARDIARSVNAGETSAVERAAAMLERIDERDPPSAPTSTVTRELAREQRERVDARIAAGERCRSPACRSRSKTTCA